MSKISVTNVKEAISTETIPFVGVDLQSAAVSVENAQGDASPRVLIKLGFPVDDIKSDLAEFLRGVIGSATGVSGVNVEVSWQVRAHAVQGTLTPLPAIKNIIAVASGKGGVGKSTTTVNLALALTRQGARVGVLDADIYGPSQPKMLGLDGQQPVSKDGKSFEPLEAHGLQANSVGFLVDEGTPVIWRGPMVTQALNQLAFSTNWRDLDYLIVDLPPGTGDIQLTLTQQVPLAGAVIVTTPQDIALLDARRGLKMFEKVNVRLLGIVENMSVHICTACGHEEALFLAGRASVARTGSPSVATRGRQLWPMAFGIMSAVAVTLLVMLVGRRETQVVPLPGQLANHDRLATDSLPERSSASPEPDPATTATRPRP